MGIKSSMEPQTKVKNCTFTTSCKVCLFPRDLCICPECSQCGERGLPRCYKDHPMKLNQEQLIQRTEHKIYKLGEELDLERNYLQWLEEQTEMYCEDWSEI